MINNYKTPLTGPVASAKIVPKLSTIAAQYRQLSEALNSGELTAKSMNVEYQEPSGDRGDLWDNTCPDTLSVVELVLPDNEIYEALFVNGIPSDEIWNRYGSIETFLQQQLGINTTQHHFEPIDIDTKDMLKHKATEMLMMARDEYGRHRETVTGAPITPHEFLIQECGLTPHDITDILKQVTPYDDKEGMQTYQIDALANFINGKGPQKVKRIIAPAGAAAYLLTCGMSGIAADCGDSPICAYDISANGTDLGVDGGIYPIHGDGTDINVEIEVKPQQRVSGLSATINITGPNDYRNTTLVGPMSETGTRYMITIPSLVESEGPYSVVVDDMATDQFRVAGPVPPIPEASTIVLFSAGAAMLGLYSYLTQNGFRRKKQE
jgi:hypothetical protein